MRKSRSSLFFFTLKAPIQYKTFVFEKRPGEDVFSLEGRMSKEISLFLRENLDYFQSFEDVILYYDNGQHELNRILNFALSAELSTYSYRKVLPKDYKLFQSADFSRLRTAIWITGWQELGDFALFNPVLKMGS